MPHRKVVMRKGLLPSHPPPAMRFDMFCEANGIEQRPTKPIHPWTNGQVERMNRTIKDATVKQFHCETHDQLRTHLAEYLAAHNFARRRKTLSGLTPYEYICKIWTSEPDRFILDPTHQMPGPNTLCVSALLSIPRRRSRPGSATGLDTALNILWPDHVF